MNFLAHLWLADRTGTSMAGSVLGDVARGADLSAYPDDIAQGIRLHRRIDAATDRHPLIVATRERFAQGQRRYAGIVLDLVCDYVLANEWAAYSPEPLDDFCRRSGQAIAEAGGRATGAAAFADLLRSYAQPAGIDHALWRVSQRMREPQPLLHAAQQWLGHAQVLREGLPRLLEDLRRVEVAPP